MPQIQYFPSRYVLVFFWHLCLVIIFDGLSSSSSFLFSLNHYGGGGGGGFFQRVRRYFTSHGLTNAENLFFHEGAIHGQAIVLGGRELSVIMDWLRGSSTIGDGKRGVL